MAAANDWNFLFGGIYVPEQKIPTIPRAKIPAQKPANKSQDKSFLLLAGFFLFLRTITKPIV